MLREMEFKYHRLLHLFIKLRFIIYFFNLAFYLIINDKLAASGLIVSSILLLIISFIPDKYFNIKRILAATYELGFILLGFILVSFTETEPMPISVYIIMLVSILSQIFIPILLFNFKNEKKYIIPILLFYVIAFLFIDDLIHITTGPNYIELIHETLSLFDWKITILIPFLGFLTIVILFINQINTNEELLLKYNEELTQSNKIINEKNIEINATLEHLKETQSQLLQAEKMASLGTLTAGVAHEINNPLNYIIGTHEGLEKYFEVHGSADKSETDFFLHSLETGVERISGIVKGLNQFSRNNNNLNEDCNLHAILDNCLAMLHNKTKSNIEIVKNYADYQIMVIGNVGKLHQLFINVLTNAIQATPVKGEIKIITKVDDSEAIIEIIDSGLGIEKKDIARITDPFFTTKPPGEGTGLGLSISYSIIKDHKGQLEFESEINRGTKVIITLPLEIG